MTARTRSTSTERLNTWWKNADAATLALASIITTRKHAEQEWNNLNHKASRAVRVGHEEPCARNDMCHVLFELIQLLHQNSAKMVNFLLVSAGARNPKKTEMLINSVFLKFEFSTEFWWLDPNRKFRKPKDHDITASASPMSRCPTSTRRPGLRNQRFDQTCLLAPTFRQSVTKLRSQPTALPAMPHPAVSHCTTQPTQEQNASQKTASNKDSNRT